MDENASQPDPSAAALSRFSALQRKIDDVVNTLGQHSETAALRDQIEQLREVSEALQSMEQSDHQSEEPRVNWVWGQGSRWRNRSRSRSWSWSRYTYDRRDDKEGSITHPTAYTERGRRRRRSPMVVTGTPERREREWSRPSQARSNSQVLCDGALICTVDRAPVAWDMSQPSWDSVFTSHVIVGYYKQISQQGPSWDWVRHRRGNPSRMRHASALPCAAERPLRVRINSAWLVEELEKITSIPLGKAPLMLLPPYKVFFMFWDQILERYKELLESGSDDEDSHELKPVDRQSHFKCLVDFITDEFSDFLDILEAVKQRAIQTISFENLWCLCEPGDVVIVQRDGVDRALVVYSVSGGRMYISGSEPAIREVVIYDAFRGRTDRRSRFARRYGSDYSDYSPFSPERGEGRRVSGAAGHYTPLTLECLFLDSDGVFVAPRQETLRIPYFAGSRDIRDLDIQLTKFSNLSYLTLERLRQRGKRFMGLSGHKLYSGAATGDGGEEHLREVYIDPATGFSIRGRELGGTPLGQLKHMDPDRGEFTFPMSREGRRDIHYDFRRESTPTSRADNDVDVERMMAFLRDNADLLSPVEVSKSLSDEQLRLLPPDIYGYVFRSRQWSFLAVDRVRDIDLDDEERTRGFEDLVIPLTYRELLLALVENHARGSKEAQEVEKSASGFMDLVAGKGKGIIILLHGPPGAGKTCTAETIAAYTKRPLYSITCGDIGTVAVDIERSLARHFQLANKWGCVLLLDEADVFMAKRDWHEMERNAAVSVFLRVLEYYSGILFLTTNRIGVIDEAFKSRIHISLRYPSFDKDSTIRVWENLLNRIERDNSLQTIKVVFDKGEILGFAESHYLENEAEKRTWNGRQIRNAFQTAIALGRTDRIKLLKKKGVTEEEAERKVAAGKDKYQKYLRIHLTRKNFEKIAKTAKDFEEYMEEVRGQDALVAKNENMRNDDYVSGAPRAQKNYRVLPGLAPQRPTRAPVQTSPPAGARHSGVANNTKDGSWTQQQRSPARGLNCRASGSSDDGSDTDDSGTSDDDS